MFQNSISALCVILTKVRIQALTGWILNQVQNDRMGGLKFSHFKNLFKIQNYSVI